MSQKINQELVGILLGLFIILAVFITVSFWPPSWFIYYRPEAIKIAFGILSGFAAIRIVMILFRIRKKR